MILLLEMEHVLCGWCLILLIIAPLIIDTKVRVYILISMRDCYVLRSSL